MAAPAITGKLFQAFILAAVAALLTAPAAAERFVTDLPLEDGGRLARSRAVRDFFDYFLTAQHEVEAHALDAMVRREIAAQLDGTAAQGEALDARSDFYSLGVMCYELLTGQKPYIGGTAMEVLQQHVNAPLPALPADLARYESFLGRLMAKSRGERFANAAEIIAATTALRGSVTPDLSATGGEAQPSAA